MSKRKEHQEELKKNELANLLESKLEGVKPHAWKIGIIALGVFALIASAMYMIASGQAKSGKEWSDLFLASYKAREDGSAKSLVNQADNLAGSEAGMWASQLSADQLFNEGARSAMQDRESALKKFELAKKSYMMVRDGSDEVKQSTRWRRATYGLGRSHEALGEFEKAKEMFQSLVDSAADSALGKAAANAIARIERPSSIAFYEAYKNHEFEVPTSTASDVAPGGDDAAPGSDLGLPFRPNFSYPVVPEAVDLPPAGNEDAPPMLNPPTDSTPKKEAPKTSADPDLENPKPPVADPEAEKTRKESDKK